MTKAQEKCIGRCYKKIIELKQKIAKQQKELEELKKRPTIEQVKKRANKIYSDLVEQNIQLKKEIEELKKKLKDKK